MNFPTNLPQWSLVLFVCLVLVGIAETTVAVPSWEIIYPFIKIRLSFLTSFFSAAEQFASATAIVSAILVVWIHRPDLRRTIAPLLVALVIATSLTTTIKFAAGRARPNYGIRMEPEQAAKVADFLKTHDNPVLKPVPGDYWLWFSKDRPGLEPFRILAGDLDTKRLRPFGEYDSFPSGHATSVMVLATFLALLFPRSRIVWYILGIGCAWARVRFRRHHPADIIVGGAIGWFTVYLVFSWVWPFRLGERILQLRAPISRVDEPHPVPQDSPCHQGSGTTSSAPNHDDS